MTFGKFTSQEDAIVHMLSQGRCPNKDCNNVFTLINDKPHGFYIKEVEYRDRIQALIDIIENTVLDEMPNSQDIFCYEDRGPQSFRYRYPTRKLKFEFRYLSRTNRASPAISIFVYDKDSRDLLAAYCFDSPYALLQLAYEALKGVKYLRDYI